VERVESKAADHAASAELTVKGRIIWLVLGYVGLAGFLALEASVREDDSSPDLDEASDEGTTRGIITAFGAAAVATPVLALLPGPRMPSWLAPLGIIVQLCGLALRRTSMVVLGRSYTRTVQTENDQSLVDEGPYALVRHPGYLGSILVWLGFALTSGSPRALGFVAALMARAYQRRIEVEEVVLANGVPGYRDYQQRTRRLIPFVW
jgi:protein-S-isoprenylcysteine O-methyltransferase